MAPTLEDTPVYVDPRPSPPPTPIHSYTVDQFLRLSELFVSCMRKDSLPPSLCDCRRGFHQLMYKSWKAEDVKASIACPTV